MEIIYVEAQRGKKERKRSEQERQQTGKCGALSNGLTHVLEYKESKKENGTKGKIKEIALETCLKLTTVIHQQTQETQYPVSIQAK